MKCSLSSLKCKLLRLRLIEEVISLLGLLEEVISLLDALEIKNWQNNVKIMFPKHLVVLSYFFVWSALLKVVKKPVSRVLPPSLQKSHATYCKNELHKKMENKGARRLFKKYIQLISLKNTK